MMALLNQHSRFTPFRHASVLVILPKLSICRQYPRNVLSRARCTNFRQWLPDCTRATRMVKRSQFFFNVDSFQTSCHRRSLSDTERADYINAVKCLQSQPAQKPLIKAARTRFDEFQALHIYVADGVHFVVSNFISLQKRYFIKILYRVISFLGIDFSYTPTRRN